MFNLIMIRYLQKISVLMVNKSTGKTMCTELKIIAIKKKIANQGLTSALPGSLCLFTSNPEASLAHCLLIPNQPLFPPTKKKIVIINKDNNSNSSTILSPDNHEITEYI